MNKLVRHIEILLLDNDCVVVPGFGGFIAHYMPALWNETEEMYYPPVRTIGFNPQLKMNDGVLVQSYMQLYDTDFPDATRILQKDIDQLLSVLHKEGKLHLPNIGEISISVQGLYVFSPYEDSLLSPVFYGADCFDIRELKSLHKVQAPNLVPNTSSASQKHYEIKINRTFLRNAVASAAAILLFFYMSAPIENTSVEKTNYAQFLLTDLLSEKQSLLTTPVGRVDAIKVSSHSDEESEGLTAASRSDDFSAQDSSQKSIVVKEVKIPKQQSKSSTAPQDDKQTVASKRYHIIIGSVKFKDDAEATVARLKSDYPNASVVVGDNKVRISLSSYSTREEADRQLIEIRKNNTYKDAWLLVR